MAKKHMPEEIMGKLREAELVLAHGGPVVDACRRIGVTERSYYRWRREYCSLKMASPAEEVTGEGIRPVAAGGVGSDARQVDASRSFKGKLLSPARRLTLLRSMLSEQTAHPPLGQSARLAG